MGKLFFVFLGFWGWTCLGDLVVCWTASTLLWSVYNKKKEFLLGGEIIGMISCGVVHLDCIGFMKPFNYRVRYL